MLLTILIVATTTVAIAVFVIEVTFVVRRRRIERAWRRDHGRQSH